MNCHLQRLFSLTQKFLKGPRFSTLNILDIRAHFKPTETFQQYTHFHISHPFNTKKGFINGEALRLLRTNSVKENFENFKRDFEQRLYKKGYPVSLVENILS